MLDASPLRLRCIPAVAGALVLALAGAVTSARAGINSWTPLGPDGGTIVSLAVSPAQPALLYAGCYSGVFRSMDGGATWVRASRGLPVSIQGVVADPKTPGTVYAFTTPDVQGTLALFKSTDAGETWRVLPAPAIVLALAIDPRTPSKLYLATGNGLFKSGNGGTSWARLSIPADHFDGIAVDPAEPSILYAVVTDATRRIDRSTDGGKTWADADAGLQLEGSFESLFELAFDTSTVPSTVYLATRNQDGSTHIFHSTNRGGSWRPSGPGGFPLAAGPGVIYAGAVKTTDRGATWTPAVVPPGGELALLAAPDSATKLYAGTSRGVWQSQDGASSWQAASSGLTATDVFGVAIALGSPEIVYASVGYAVQGDVLLQSAGGNTTWQLAGPYVGYLMAVDSLAPRTLYVGSSDGLQKSEDGGLSWEVLGTSAHCFSISALALDSAHSGTLYAGGTLGCPGTTCTTFKSEDRGQSWTCLGLEQEYVTALVVAPSLPATVYARTASNQAPQSSLFKSTDAGGSWTDISDHLRRYGVFLALAVDPTDANRVYLAAEHGVFRSTDGGRTWIEADHRLPLPIVGSEFFSTVLAVDPNTPATLYLGGAFGIYRSTNHGRTWSAISAGLPDRFGGALVLDPQHPGTVYASTFGSGLYSYTAE